MKITYIEFPEAEKVIIGEEEKSIENLPRDMAVIRNEMTLASSGTELARFRGLGGDFPVRPGYTAIGEIIAKHDSITDFEVGDRVFYAGRHATACFAEHNQDHQWGRLYETPKDLPAETALYAGLAQISYTAPLVSGAELGDTVAIFGLGQIGNLAAQLYQLKGARVLAFDPVEVRCEQARQCGLREVFSTPPQEQAAKIKDLTDGEGADITVDAVGNVRIIETAIAATCLMGKVVLLGTPWTPALPKNDKLFHDIHMNGLQLLGGHMWRYPAAKHRGAPHNVETQYRRLFQQIAAGHLNVEPLLSHIVKAEQAPEIYDGLLNKPDQYRGVAFDWRDGQ